MIVYFRFSSSNQTISRIISPCINKYKYIYSELVFLRNFFSDVTIFTKTPLLITRMIRKRKSHKTLWTVISLNKSISHESWAHIITDFDNWMLEREDERFFSLRVPPPTDHEGPRTDWQTDWQMVCVITRAHSPTNRKWIASRCKVVDSALNLGTCHKRTCHRYMRRIRKTLEWKSIEFIYITRCQEIFGNAFIKLLIQVFISRKKI